MSFDSQELPDGTYLVEVEEFVIEVDTVQSPPLMLRGPAGGADPSRPDPEVAGLHDSLSEIASVIARDFLTWVRLHLRQYWLAPTGKLSPHESLIWNADSEDILMRQEFSPGRPIPFTMLASVPGRGIALTGPAASPSLNKILAGETAGATGLPERLLSSAFGKLWSAYPDPQTAVFLSAVTCETKVKTALSAKAAAAQRPLLDLILDNPRDVTITALNHFDRLCKVITGRSLKEDEDNRRLWKRLDRLIQARNSVAHRGFEPTREEAERHIETAVDVFGWLDSVLALDISPASAAESL
jgi:hypothetical protein